LTLTFFLVILSFQYYIKQLNLKQRCSAGQAELFKTVNSNYGNTEKSAIAQATVINSRGLYRIGKVDGLTNEFKVCSQFTKV